MKRKLDPIIQDPQKSGTQKEREEFTYKLFVWATNLYLWTINVTTD